MKLALTLRLAAIAPMLALGVPLQALAKRTGLISTSRLPNVFHRYTARVLGLKIQLDGHAQRQGGVLYVANHVSWLDIVVISAVLPVSFIAKSDIAGWPVFGMLARLQNSIFVDRQRRQATGTVAEMVAMRLSAGDAVVLFAEGTTSDGTRVLPFRSALLGAARTDSEEGRPPVRILPLAITYTHKNGLPLTRRDMPEIAWYADMDLLPHLTALVSSGKIDAVVSIGEPMFLEHANDRKKIAAQAETWTRCARRAARERRVSS